MNVETLRQRIEEIEEGYEFFLAYAAQGASEEAAALQDAQLREYLGRVETALGALIDGPREMIESGVLEPPGPYGEVAEVLAADARNARAAVRLVLAQAVITSQLIDNLNASSHLRALLTDLFLLDETL